MINFILQSLWGSFVLSSDENTMDSRSSLGADGKYLKSLSINSVVIFLLCHGDFAIIFICCCFQFQIDFI